jgi:hypothetical protein
VEKFNEKDFVLNLLREIIDGDPDNFIDYTNISKQNYQPELLKMKGGTNLLSPEVETDLSSVLTASEQTAPETTLEQTTQTRSFNCNLLTFSHISVLLIGRLYVGSCRKRAF